MCPVDGRWEVVVSRSILLLACVLVAADASAQALQTATEAAHNDNVATGTAAAPATKPTTPTTTFRSSVDLVALNVVVTDGEQKYVSGLSPSDFAVFEDGIQQDVSFFGASDVPIDLAILLDTSASMTGKMQLVQQAAIGFLDTLRPGDRAIIVDIKDATKIMFPLGGDLAAAKQAILATAPRGGTALYNGTYLTLKELTKERRGEQRGSSSGDRRAVGRRRYGQSRVLRRPDGSGQAVGHRDLYDHDAVEIPGHAGGVARAFVLLAIGVRNEGAGAGDGCAGVLPDPAWRTGRRLCVDRAGAGDAVHASVTPRRTRRSMAAIAGSSCESPTSRGFGLARAPATPLREPSASHRRPATH